MFVFLNVQLTMCVHISLRISALPSLVFKFRCCWAINKTCTYLKWLYHIILEYGDELVTYVMVHVSRFVTRVEYGMSFAYGMVFNRHSTMDNNTRIAIFFETQ